MKNTKNKLINLITIFSLLVSSLYIYTPQKALAADSWSTGAAGGAARNSHESVVYNGKIYSWGGRIGGDYANTINTMDIYDIASNAWSTGTAGGTGRNSFAANLSSSKIYYWGGYGSNGVNINTVDIYDITTDSWTTGTAGGTPRWATEGILYQNKIYYWGGSNDITCLTSIDIYDISSDSWLTGNSGGTGRCFYSANIHNGKIYYWGGYDGSYVNRNIIDIYDITNNSWSVGVSGGTSRSTHTNVIYNNQIYFWGGGFGGSYLNTVDIYDILANSWSTGTTGGTARAGHSSILYDGKMYSWAGYYRSGSWYYLNTLDIYDTGYHPNPEFQNLPGDTVPINLEEGQTISTPTYTIEVYPTSPNEIEKVEFYVDNVLIDTDYVADGDGVYSTIWDTTLYHSDIRVVAYDPFGRTTELTRTVTVDNGSNNNNGVSTTITELPATGMERISY